MEQEERNGRWGRGGRLRERSCARQRQWLGGAEERDDGWHRSQDQRAGRCGIARRSVNGAAGTAGAVAGRTVAAVIDRGRRGIGVSGQHARVAEREQDRRDDEK